MAREQGVERREEGDARQRQEVGEASAEAQDEPTADAYGSQETHTTRKTEAEREADARQRASNFL